MSPGAKYLSHHDIHAVCCRASVLCGIGRILEPEIIWPSESVHVAV